MIRQCPIGYNLPKKSNEKEKIIKLSCETDLSYESFKLAWNEVCKEMNKLLYPKDIICNFINPELCDLLNLAITGDILIANTRYVDEWWITFVDPDGNNTNVIFYSEGA